MPPHRLLAALACLSALALTACASTIPWPPPSGSCVEAYKPPGRRRATRYWIGGQPAEHTEVERTVYDTPALRTKARRAELVSVLSPILAGTGTASAIASIPVTAATGKPGFALLAAPGLLAMVTGLVLGAIHEDPFRRAVVTFNDEARRKGRCVDGPQPRPPPPEPKEPLDPVPPSREPFPVLPSGGWKP
jgi:hypothetical protein